MSIVEQLNIPLDSPFSIRNLPYSAFTPQSDGRVRIGVAIGDYILDLAALENAGLLGERPTDVLLFDRPTLNTFLAQGRPIWYMVRRKLSELLVSDSSLVLDLDLQQHMLYRQSDCQLHMPVEIGDYTDFYSSREHASNVGAMFRDPNNPLLPNWTHMPIAYHGRSSTVGLSGMTIRRPSGQVRPGDTDPILSPTRELDFELEVGFIVGPGNPAGQPIGVDQAADHIFGLVLVNDWSARDIQRWEYQPLGPFLGKNFATSLSPWIVPLAALEEFRCAGPKQDPKPLPYLQTTGDWAFDIHLEARLQTAAMKTAGLPPVTLSETNFRKLYWNMTQQLAHHTVNGCAMRPGDLLASGTISGSDAGSYGSLLELTRGGRQPLVLPNGESRSFLEDGDTLTLSGWSQGDGYRVGFGEVSGTIFPAHPLSQ